MSENEQEIRRLLANPASSALISREHIAELLAELEQARSTCPHSNCDAQRYRDALERIRRQAVLSTALEIAREALAGKGQT